MKSLLFGNRRSLGLGGLIGTVALAVPTLWGTGIVPTEVEVLDGIAWLANEASGTIVRINGETGQVDAKVGFEESQGILGVNQNGSSVLVTVGDQVHSIDVAALDWGATTAASDGLVIAEGVAYLVSAEGAVRALDPVTLATLGEVALGEAPAGRATTVGKRLIVPLVDGTAAVVATDEVETTAKVGDAGDEVHLSAVGRTVVALNVSAGEVYRLDAKRGKLRGPVDVDVPSGELIVPQRLNAGRLWLLDVDRGELVGIAPSSGRVVTAKVADGGHDLVGPVVDDGHVYLVDRTAKTIVQVPVKTMKPQSHPLAVSDASRVELTAEGGKIFVNDPLSALAVVIDGGTLRNVDKYDDEGIATATPPNTKTPPPPRPAPQGPPAGPPKVAPAPPGNVAAQAGNESATVSWSPGAGGGVASSFFVSYDGDTVEVPGNRLSAPIDDLENGEEYVFEVWAENEYGESDPVASNAVVPNDRVPGTPEAVEATAGDTTAQVTWAAADDRGREISAYIVTSAPDGITTTVPGNATQAEVTGLANGTTYTFTVTAVNDLDVQGEPSAPSAGLMPYGPPGVPVNVTVDPSDGTLAVDWDASANLSDQPVEYAIAVEPADATPAPTQETQATIGGLVNGITYRVMITPSNDRGPGEPVVIENTPGRQPSGTMTVNRTGDRTFNVTLDVDDGGRSISGCTIRWDGGSRTCTGDGTYAVTVGTYNTPYTFSATLTNAFGDGSGGTGAGTSNTKPYTIRSDGSAFDGTCTWSADAGGRPNTRPYFRNARHTCPMWDPAGDRPVGYLALGSGVRGQCHTQGGSIKDDNQVSTTTWIRLTTGYYMPTIYFTNFQSGPIDGLPSC